MSEYLTLTAANNGFKIWLLHIPPETALEKGNAADALLQDFCSNTMDTGHPPQSYGLESFLRAVVVDHQYFGGRTSEIIAGKHGDIELRFHAQTGPGSIEYWVGVFEDLLADKAPYTGVFEISHGSKAMRQAAVLAAVESKNVDLLLDGKNCFPVPFVKTEPHIRVGG